MIIGVPKEVKDHESRVGTTPTGVKSLVDAGHKLLVETGAGELANVSGWGFGRATPTKP